MKHHHEYDRNDNTAENQTVYLTTHLSTTHTHTHHVPTDQGEWQTPVTNIADTQIISAWVRICNLWTLSSRWAAWGHKGATEGSLLTTLQTNKLTNRVGLDFYISLRNSNMADIFCRGFCWNPRRVADCPFLCQYYCGNTDCLQPTAPTPRF